MSCFVNNIITEMVLKNQRNQVDNEHAFTSPATAGSFKKLFGKIIWYAKILICSFVKWRKATFYVKQQQQKKQMALDYS